MSTPFHFTPRVPAAPHPTPASASGYSLPNPRALRPPIHNPYDKFTQPEFDAWIGGITGALRSALGQDDEKPLPPTQNSGAPRQIIDERSRYTSIEDDESADDLVDDSFAEVKARRAIGKGKARDPREGPGLRKEHNIQPIEVISSDEEEEEEVELSIAPFDDEESEVEEEEQNDEDEEESATEEYAWEMGQSSSQYIPPLEKGKTVQAQHEQLHEDNEAEYEEYEDEEYEEDEEGSDQLRESNTQVIEVLSDDEETAQSKPLEPQGMGLSYEDDGGLEEGLEEEDQENQEEYDEYSEEEQDGEIMVPPGSQYCKSVSVTRYPQDEHAADEEEQDEIDDGIQEIQPTSSHGQPAQLSDESGNHNGIPDHWRDPQTYAEDFYAGDDVRPSGDLRDASRLATEDVIDLEDGDDDHAEETDNEIQPLSQDTSFPPEPTVSSSNVKEHIEIPDRWSGPKQYAQDYYSGGQVVLPSDGRADPSHLGPGDSEYSILDAEEEELAEEIEDEIQPLEADTSFPPQEPMDEDVPVIVDPWLGAHTYAQDFYYDGDIRILPGGRIDPFFLHGSADLDNGIDSFLTPGALSPNPSDERTSIGDDEGNGIQGPPEHYVAVPSTRGQPIPYNAEFISVDDSDDEPVQVAKASEALPHFDDTIYHSIYNFDEKEGAPGAARGDEVVDEEGQELISPPAIEACNHDDIRGTSPVNAFDRPIASINVDLIDNMDEGAVMNQHADVSDGGDKEQVQIGDISTPVPINIHHGSPEVVQPAEVGRESSLEIVAQSKDQEGASLLEDISTSTLQADEFAPYNERDTLVNLAEGSLPSGESVTTVDEGVVDVTSTEQRTDILTVDDTESHKHELEIANLPVTEVVGELEIGGERDATIDNVASITEGSSASTPTAKQVEDMHNIIVQPEENTGDAVNRLYQLPPSSDNVHCQPEREEEISSPKTIFQVEYEEVLDEDIPLNTQVPSISPGHDDAEPILQYSVIEASEGVFVDVTAHKELDPQDIEVISVASAFGAGDNVQYGEDVYSVEEIANGRLSEKPYDRAMSLSVVSVGQSDEIIPSAEHHAPSTPERIPSPSISYHSTHGQHEKEPTNGDVLQKEFSVPPESSLVKDGAAEGTSDARPTSLDVILDADTAATNILPEVTRPQSPIINSTQIGDLLSSGVDASDRLPTTLVKNNDAFFGSNSSDVETICPTPRALPDVLAMGTSYDDIFEASFEQQHTDPHHTEDNLAIVAEDPLLDIVSSTQPPDVPAEPLVQERTITVEEHRGAAVILPSPEEAESPADKQINVEDRYRQVAVPTPASNILSRLPTAPTFINDAYPYNLSAPNVLSRLFTIPTRYGLQAKSPGSPHSPLRTHTAGASSSTLQTYTPAASTFALQAQPSSAPTPTPTLQAQFQSPSHALQTQASTVAPQTQRKDAKDRDDNSAETASVAGDWDELDEFQYPPEQSIIAEFRNDIPALPISQHLKAEDEISAVKVNTAITQLPINHNSASDIEPCNDIGAAGLTIVENPVPASSPSSLKDTIDDAALHMPSRPDESSDSKVETSPNKTAGSSKKSSKRKRETSPGPHIGTKPTASQKNKGRRSSKADRKGKAQELVAEVPEPTSEGTIHVRPRPKDSPTQSSAIEASGKPVDVFSTLPTYRILQTASRASSAASDPSDKLAGVQQSPTTNKPNKHPVQPPPLTSLFHAHGRGRKQQSMSNIPPKLAKQIQVQKAPSVYASPPSKKSELSTSAALPAPVHPPAPIQIVSEITPLIIPTPEVQPIASASSVAPSEISPTVVSHFASSPAPVTAVITSPTASAQSSIPPTVVSTAPAPPLMQTTTVSQASPTVHTPSHHSKPARTASMTNSPVTRSHCRYHRISLPKEENGPRIWFLVPGCSLNDKELMDEEEIVDHGDATVEDSHRMIKDIESLNFHSDLVGILRQLVGLDILREQEVFYLPQPGEEVPRRNSLKKSTSEKTAMVRVPADSSSYAGSPEYSGGYPGSPGSFRAVTSVTGSRSPSISGLRSFLDSEKGSSFAPSDTEHSGGEEPDTKRSRPSPPEETKVMGPPPSIQPKGKEKAKRSHKAKPKADGEVKEARKPRKSTSKRGVKRSRTSEVYNATEEGEPNSKKLKAHATEPGPSPEKPPPS